MNFITNNVFFKLLDRHRAPDDSISTIGLMSRVGDALVTVSKPVIIAKWIILQGDEVVRIHDDTSWVFSCGHNLGR